MKKGHYRQDVALDLHTPWTDHEKEVIAKVGGPAPIHEPVERQPYDELYVKQKRLEEL